MRKKIHPYIYIIFTFLGVILTGTILLALPISSSSGKSFGFVNSLFMSTSAVCVTGLSVLENGVGVDMTVFGKVVMWFLMEIGGLSIITIAVFFFTIIGAKLGISNRFLLRESLNQNSVKNITNLVSNIVAISFTIQLIGVLINLYPFYQFTEYLNGGEGDLMQALGISIFHACASFNNAGFDIFGPEGMLLFSSTSTVVSKSSIYIINFSTDFMIVTGGLGFVVIKDFLENGRWSKMSLHSKITIIITAVLIVSGTLIFKFSTNMGWLEALFSSITLRTAGFQTFNMANLTQYPVAYIASIVLMIIGASPCSTGGGIKTTTMAVIMMAIYHFAIGKKTKAFRRSISNDQIIKAFVLLNLAIMLVVVGSFVVLAIQPELTVDKTVYEVTSAFSTTGVSMGITTSLKSVNKLILCFLMLFGRLGPLTVIGVLNKNWMNNSSEKIKYVEESVIIG